mgnify:CR=1 FL=1|tara:strand:+ start:495 stop:1064 length:570 start_codon:yes stop_codon:yes gene_type:complete
MSIITLNTRSLPDSAVTDAKIAGMTSSKLSGDLPAISGASLTGIEGTVTGTILSWSTASVPTGFLECDGSAVSRSTYSALFSAIGTTYGAGDGSSTFNLPNMQDKVQVGKSSGKALASTGGSETHTLATSELPSHLHASGGSSTSSAVSEGGIGGMSSFVTGGNTGNTGGGSAHSIMQPYIALLYIIKT